MSFGRAAGVERLQRLWMAGAATWVGKMLALEWLMALAGAALFGMVGASQKAGAPGIGDLFA